MLHVCIVAGAEAHDQVGVLGYHVEQRDGDLQRQVDLGVGLGELAQARDQDGARKGGCHGQLQAPLAGLAVGAGKALQRAQAFAYVREVGAAVRGEREVGTPEQARAQDLFQLLDAVAYRAGRDAQFISGERDAAQTRKRLEGEQALDGRDAAQGAGIHADHRGFGRAAH
ncbi:hypothetical protein SDC9_118066 [bioreactor metagenome]|uniref:Uncharacterized protein n=1 Tax=bioreactor metagenome TaxID=1076179 RepID=A0A645C704_9ZZZZ